MTNRKLVEVQSMVSSVIKIDYSGRSSMCLFKAPVSLERRLCPVSTYHIIKCFTSQTEKAFPRAL